MSDLAAETTIDAGAATPDVTISDVAGTPSVPEADSADAFGGLDLDKVFGVPPETPAAEPETTPDVPEATNQPVPRQDDKEVTQADEPAAEKPEAEVIAEPKDGQFASNEKLNWDDDKVPFRQEFKNLKAAYMAQMESSPESQYLNDPAAFTKWMEETSPTSFTEVGTQIATRSAEEHPKAWIEYFAQSQPDLLAEIVTGREGMTADRLKAELDVLLDDDDADVQAALEKRQAAATTPEKPVETPEQKEVREWREQRQAEAHQKVVAEVFTPIENAVENLVSEAGLGIKESEYQGKDFSTLDADTQFKVMVNELISPWIDIRIKQDPKLVNMQARLEEFIAKGDLTSAKQLQHPAQIFATNCVNELLGILTQQKAKLARSETAPPAKDTPRQLVKSAGAGQISNGNGKPTADDWAVTDADLFGKG